MSECPPKENPIARLIDQPVPEVEYLLQRRPKPTSDSSGGNGTSQATPPSHHTTTHSTPGTPETPATSAPTATSIGDVCHRSPLGIERVGNYVVYE
ncbi:hypothetical protein MRX96_021893 [Rhipicephalus microplus]